MSLKACDEDEQMSVNVLYNYEIWTPEGTDPMAEFVALDESIRNKLESALEEESTAGTGTICNIGAQAPDVVDNSVDQCTETDVFPHDIAFCDAYSDPMQCELSCTPAQGYVLVTYDPEYISYNDTEQKILNLLEGMMLYDELLEDDRNVKKVVFVDRGATARSNGGTTVGSGETAIGGDESLLGDDKTALSGDESGDETAFTGDETTVGGGETALGGAETTVGGGETALGGDETMVGGGENTGKGGETPRGGGSNPVSSFNAEAAQAMDEPSSGLSPGAAAGIALGLLALISLIALALRRRRRGVDEAGDEVEDESEA